MYDKKGKEVYHADIVKNGESEFIVSWDNNNARFVLTERITGRKWNTRNVKYCEVVGNTYQNKIKV